MSVTALPVVAQNLCGVDGCQVVAKSPAGLGSHKRRAHGILGTAPNSVKAREQSAARKAQGAKKPESKPAPVSVPRVSKEMRIVAAVQATFPNGIQTKDPDQLLLDLAGIDYIRQRIGS
jgi:hypothetical protein